MTVILHVITDLDAGGAERMLAHVATGGGAIGRQVVVSLMDDGVYGAELRKAGVTVHCLGLRRSLAALSAPIRLALILRRERPDVVMSWLYHADLMATLALLLSGLGTGRLIWNLRCSDVDLRQYAQSTRWVVSLLARLSSLPGAIAANSQAGRAYHASLGYRPRRWIDLPNGFDLVEWRPDAADRAAVRAEWSLDDATLAIGMIARVDPSKDHATLFEAAVQVRASRKDVRVVLIGRGTDRLALPAVLDDLVLVLGERRDVGRLVRGLDMAVLSSLTEGFPNVVGEAMASGVPCVVTDTGDSAQIVGDTGMVVPSRSAEALAGAILKLAGESTASRQQRGEAARRRIAGHFGLERALQLYWSAWLSVAAASQPRSGQGP